MYLSDTVLSHVEEMSDAPDLSGTRYEVGERLGKGGMGTVWLARDTQLDREVAVKVSASAHEPELAERLTREAKVIAQLEHPGIVPVHDAGVLSDGRVFYVMKRVRGERFDAWAKAHDLRERLRLFQRVCEAVAFAHARGVMHRDLKPENVMVGEFGEALVMDWGLAKRGQATFPTSTSGSRAAPEDAAATGAGAVLGTPAYMAPEQARGEAVGPAADVYGLGAMLYALLAGCPPGPQPAALAGHVPVALGAICGKAMAAVASERYASARALGDDVGRWLDLEPVLARKETLLERGARFVSKNRVVLSLLAAYVLVRLVLLWL